VGYREVVEHLQGQLTLAETIQQVQLRTRQFAKRQATWFRGLAEVRSWPVARDEAADVTAVRLMDAVSQF
jgi:tRNA dimethylallyltransferase